MRCEDLADQLTAFLEGELDPQLETAAIDHIAECAACDRVLSATRDTARLMADHGRPVLDDHDRNRMLDALLDGLGS